MENHNQPRVIIENTFPPLRLLRWPEVSKRCGISRPTAHNLASKGKFPKPVKINPDDTSRNAASAWVEEEINGWINEKINESRPGSVA